MTWVALVPKLVALIAAVVEYAIAAKERGLGRAEAVAEALTLGAEQVRAASLVRSQAQADHASKSDDTAFDPDFQRKD